VELSNPTVVQTIRETSFGTAASGQLMKLIPCNLIAFLLTGLSLTEEWLSSEHVYWIQSPPRALQTIFGLLYGLLMHDVLLVREKLQARATMQIDLGGQTHAISHTLPEQFGPLASSVTSQCSAGLSDQ